MFAGFGAEEKEEAWVVASISEGLLWYQDRQYWFWWKGKGTFADKRKERGRWWKNSLYELYYSLCQNNLYNLAWYIQKSIIGQV